MKKSTVVALVLVSAFAFSSNAFAKKQQSVHFNMHDLTCGELITMDEESMGVMLMWLDGFVGPKSNFGPRGGAFSNNGKLRNCFAALITLVVNFIVSFNFYFQPV